jgi:hypothetical protein
VNSATRQGIRHDRAQSSDTETAGGPNVFGDRAEFSRAKSAEVAKENRIRLRLLRAWRPLREAFRSAPPDLVLSPLYFPAGPIGGVAMPRQRAGRRRSAVHGDEVYKPWSRFSLTWVGTNRRDHVGETCRRRKRAQRARINRSPSARCPRARRSRLEVSGASSSRGKEPRRPRMPRWCCRGGSWRPAKSVRQDSAARQSK